MSRPITLSSVPPSYAAYPTVGDWRHRHFHDEITCADIGGDPRSVLLVQCHELFEMILSDLAGVKEEDVTAFDIAHPELDEPGDSPDAPYHAAHMAAMDLERRLCEYMNLPWHQHEQNVAQIADAVDIALQSKTSEHPSTHDLLLP